MGLENRRARKRPSAFLGDHAYHAIRDFWPKVTDPMATCRTFGLKIGSLTGGGPARDPNARRRPFDDLSRNAHSVFPLKSMSPIHLQRAISS